MTAPFQPNQVVLRVGIPERYFRVKKCIHAGQRYGVLLVGVHCHDENGFHPTMFKAADEPTNLMGGKDGFDFRKMMGARA